MNLSKGRRQLRTRLLEKNLKSKRGNSYSDLKDLLTANCGLMPLNVVAIPTVPISGFIFRTCSSR